MSNLKESVYAAIAQVAEAEAITRSALAGLSRDLLLYVPDSQDIECVNRLISVLTPMNKKIAVMYFRAMLPWTVENDADGNFLRFGKKMVGDKKVKARLAAITTWLSDEKNTIWTWADKNVELKQKDFKAILERAIKKALSGDEKTDTPALSTKDVCAIFMQSDIPLEEMLDAMGDLDKANQDAHDPIELAEAS